MDTDIMLANAMNANAISNLVRRNSAKIETVWGQTARTNIPEVPITGLPYRRADLSDNLIEQGQGYNYIYDGAEYNQILFLITSLWKSMCENGGMPFQKGQTYQQGGLCIYDGRLFLALRAIDGDESPYPMPDESPYWYDLSPNPFTGKTTSKDGALGLVPQPKAGEQSCMLSSIGKWVTHPSPFPTGSIIAYAGKTSPSNDWLFCDGRTVKRAEYANLFSVIGTKYGAGDGSTTFQIPDLRNRILQGSNTVGTYQYYSAGVPSMVHTHSASLNTLGIHTHTASASSASNHTHSRGTWDITGTYNGQRNWGDHSGAFYLISTSSGDGKSGNRGIYGFQASRAWSGSTSSAGDHNHTWSFGADNGHTHGVSINSNSEINPEIYGKANTVQMSACTANYLIKV